MLSAVNGREPGFFPGSHCRLLRCNTDVIIISYFGSGYLTITLRLPYGLLTRPLETFKVGKIILILRSTWPHSPRTTFSLSHPIVFFATNEAFERLVESVGSDIGQRMFCTDLIPVWGRPCKMGREEYIF